MALSWSENQAKIIEDRGNNIIVSAAAGSGKTAVLVARIIKLILEDKISVDRLLVVTFTKAAAGEMKERIRVALQDKLREDNLPKEDRRYILSQLSLLSQADISTFHSFAQKVVKNYFYLTPIESGFKIFDEETLNIIRAKALDNAIYEGLTYGMGNVSREDFKELLSKYGSLKSLEGFKEMTLEFYNTLMAMPYPWKWAGLQLKLLKAIGEERGKDNPLFVMERNKGIGEAEETIRDLFITDSIGELILEIREYLDELKVVISNSKMTSAKSKKATETMEAIIETLDYVDIKSHLIYKALKDKGEREIGDGKSLSKFFTSIIFKDSYFPVKLTKASLSLGKDSPEVFTKAKEALDRLSKIIANYNGKIQSIKSKSSKEYLLKAKESTRDTNKSVRTFLEFVRKFHLDFAQDKIKNKGLDFSDLEHFALKILENADVASYYQESFDYIFVDEFQDTNKLQDTIISKIARKDNLFMVGDIKQSIYQFRLADPKIFQQKREEYNFGKEYSKAYYLSENYRSKKEVLDFVNNIFRKIMDGYDENEQLNYPGIELETKHLPQCCFIDTKAGDEDDEIEGLTKEEREAHFICDLVEKQLEKEIVISQEIKDGVLVEEKKKVDLEDIAILLPKLDKVGYVFERVFRERNIGLAVQNRGSSFLDSLEVKVIIDLLTVIDNITNDTSLVATLHSELFNFSLEELGKIRSVDRSGYFYQSMRLYIEDGEDKNLVEKSKGALKTIEDWKMKASSMELGKFLWQLITRTKYYILVGSYPNGEKRQGNLRKLVDLVDKYSTTKSKTIFGFIAFVEWLKKYGGDFKSASESEETTNCVSLMTIHKSKGLQFPVVFVAGLGYKINYDTGNKIMLHKDVGIGADLVDKKLKFTKPNRIKELILEYTKKEQVEEVKRLLYVAFTRAKDILYLVGSVNKEKYQKNNTYYAGLLAEAIEPKWYSPEIVEEEISKGDSYSLFFKDQPSEEDKTRIINRLEYRYPYEESQNQRSVYGVTKFISEEDELNVENTLDSLEDEKGLELREIKALESETSEGCKTFDNLDYHYHTALGYSKLFSNEKHKLTAAEKGSLIHKVFELMDFKEARAETMWVQDFLLTLEHSGYLSAYDAENVNLEEVVSFLKSDLFEKMKKADEKGQLYREQPFVLKVSKKIKEINGKEQREDVILQGIIDAYIEEEDGITLIDYKTNKVDKAKVEEEKKRLGSYYEKQMYYYKEALEEGTGKKVKDVYLFSTKLGESILVNV